MKRNVIRTAMACAMAVTVWCWPTRAGAPVDSGSLELTQWNALASLKIKAKHVGDKWMEDITISFGPDGGKIMTPGQFVVTQGGDEVMTGTYVNEGKGKVTMTCPPEDIEDQVAGILSDIASDDGVFVQNLTVDLLSQKSTGKGKKGKLKTKLMFKFMVNAMVDGEPYASKGSWAIKIVGTED